MPSLDNSESAKDCCKRLKRHVKCLEIQTKLQSEYQTQLQLQIRDLNKRILDLGRKNECLQATINIIATSLSIIDKNNEKKPHCFNFDSVSCSESKNCSTDDTRSSHDCSSCEDSNTCVPTRSSFNCSSNDDSNTSLPTRSSFNCSSNDDSNTSLSTRPSLNCSSCK